MNSLRAADGASHVILVIDDDYAVRNSLKFTLEVEGFKVRAYSDAQELLNEAREELDSYLALTPAQRSISPRDPSSPDPQEITPRPRA